MRAPQAFPFLKGEGGPLAVDEDSLRLLKRGAGVSNADGGESLIPIPNPHPVHAHHLLLSPRKVEGKARNRIENAEE